MTIETKRLENLNLLVKISGRIDTVTSLEFQDKLAPLMVEKNKEIELDCSELEYTSSSGLRQFLLLQKKSVENNTKLTLTHMQPSVKEVFDITGFSNIITII